MGKGSDEMRGDGGSFEQRLEVARRRAGLDSESTDSRPAGGNPLSFAMQLGAEMVAALAIAIAIGYGLDKLFHTSPWIMVAFVPIGAAAGVLNLIRAMGPTKR